MSLAERRGLRLFLFSSMFFAQGIGWSFMATRVPAIISAHGMTIASAGTVLSVTVLPYALKWVWGPIMDAFTIARFGRRRPWLVFSQAMMAVSAASLLFVDDYTKNFDLLLGLMLVHTVFNAMQNVAADALALDLIPVEERGRANGIMYGSKYAGGVAGGLGMAELASHAGQQVAVIAMAGVLAAITLVPLLLKEHSGPQPPQRPIGQTIRMLGRVLQLRSVLVMALVMVLHNIGGGLLSAVSSVLYEQKLGWSEIDYSDLTGGPALVAGFVGSLVAGMIADKIGHRRFAMLAIGALGGVWLAFALLEPMWTNRTLTWTLALVEPFVQANMVVALWSLCMDTTSKPTATTQFAMYTSLMNASTLIATRIIAAHAADWWDFRTMYFLAAAAQLVVLALVPFINTREARDKLDHSAPTASVSSKPSE